MSKLSPTQLGAVKAVIVHDVGRRFRRDVTRVDVRVEEDGETVEAFVDVTFESGATVSGSCIELPEDAVTKSGVARYALMWAIYDMVRTLPSPEEAPCPDHPIP